MFTSRSNGGTRVTSRPASSMSPSSGSSNPAIIRSIVVFPDPDGPSSEKNSPSRTSRSTWSTAATSPKRFTRPVPRTAIAAAASAEALPGSSTVAKRLLEDREPAVELLVGRDERDEDPDHVRRRGRS